ncbi:CC0125/CC1285 family lipoprotein [Sphingomonas sp. DT-207]|uniref:CC0125/CC1285 family lipoprotein n=1 Tax=Sphingomonas sp. DT-207 TaxID=3396167 RepID=UPI003F1B84C8
MLKGIIKRSRLAALAAALAGSAALAGCMTATPYQPATNSSRMGYSEEQIESNRFRVSFAGNTITSRETVERYLLYRAAELTVQQGFDHFILADRDTEAKTEIRRTPSAYGPGPWGYWSPYWRYYRPRWGWRTWDPFWDDPFWNDRDFDYRTVRQYEAVAEIVMGRGPKPDNVRAFDARDVLNRLGPQIQRPTQR